MVALGIVTVWAAPALANVVLLGSDRSLQNKEAIAAARQVGPEFSFADEDSNDAAEQLRHADVVLAIGVRALVMARTVAPDKPVVYAMVPAAEALPSKTVTGVAWEVPAYAQFAEWKQLRFDGLRVGVLYHPKSSAASLADATKAAAALGLTLVARPLSDSAKLSETLAELGPKIDALWVAPDDALFPAATIRTLVAFARKSHVALLGYSDAFTDAGALASMAPDARDIGRRAARMALGIAGRAPEQRLPVPPPTSSPGTLSLNAVTAAELGIDLPETLLHKARKVVH